MGVNVRSLLYLLCFLLSLCKGLLVGLLLAGSDDDGIGAGVAGASMRDDPLPHNNGDGCSRAGGCRSGVGVTKGRGASVSVLWLDGGVDEAGEDDDEEAVVGTLTIATSSS
jgi:hypothetical protein